MTVSMEQLTGWVTGFLWPFFRIAAVVTMAPILGAKTNPVWFRIGIAAALTLVAMPLLPPGPGVDPVSAEGLLITLCQIVIGLAIGFVVRMAFAAIETGGALIGQSMGLGFAQMMDPANGVTVPVISQFYTLMATLVFLGLDGHLVLIEVLVESFRVIPVSPHALGEQGLWLLLSWAGWIFKGAVIISLPAVAALLLVNIAFGVMSRAAPQLNIFAIGFPVSLMLGFVFMLVSLPLFAPQFSDLMNQAFIGIRGLIAEAPSG
jgi:flagellar biosynthetic protein FliR